MKSRTRPVKLILCALFAALTTVLSQLTIPIGAVPINLAHVSILTAAGLMGGKYGALSQAVFVLMGAAGIPVFSGFSGGLGIILGPTAGYIAAYVGTAFVTGFIIERFGKSLKILIVAMYAGWAVTYILGTIWYAYVTQTHFIAALMVCVVPFLIGDCLKTVLSIFLIKRLSRVL